MYVYICIYTYMYICISIEIKKPIWVEALTLQILSLRVGRASEVNGARANATAMLRQRT